MSGLHALTLDQPILAESQPHKLTLVFDLASGTPTQVAGQGAPLLFGTAAGDFSQAAVNDLLEFDKDGERLSATSTSEVDASTAFGSTAMGIDAFACVVACGGQVEDVYLLEYAMYDDAVIGAVAKSSSLPDTLTEQLVITPAGNLVFRAIPTGLDSETGHLVVTIHFVSK